MDLFISAGEPSGDLQGAKLIEKLLHLSPQLKIGAVAGPRMRALPIESLFSMESLQVMGFIDVLLALPKIGRQFFAIRRKILELSPKAVVCIDYPGFHLRLEKSLRKAGYKGKLIHYVCPTVWAWGKKRIPPMAENLDLLLTLFPFEKSCFSHTQLPVQYVGHPLAHSIPHSIQGSPIERQKILGLFPGSRKTEIERNFPLQVQVAKKMLELDPSMQIGISIAHENFDREIRRLADGLPAFFAPPSLHYELMRSSFLALATSGTVTLELALHSTPTVVNFAIKPLDRFIAQKIFRINLPFYCISNILISKPVFPELFGPNLTESQLFFWTKKLWFDPHAREECLAGCAEIRKTLGSRDSALEAAQAILSLAPSFAGEH